MTSLLVIGGSGFFGKSILDSYKRGLLIPWGINRIEVVARKASNLATSNPELMSKNVLLHDLDITSCTYLPVADYVIHAAASSDATNYLVRPEQERINIQLGTANFCRLAGQYLTNSKILYVSSGAAYGRQPEEMTYIEEGFSFQDLETLEPGKRDYAAAKRDGERYIESLGSGGLNVAIARCFAFVGLYLPREQHFAIGNFIEDGLQGRPIAVNARHPVYRSYLYADDLVCWLLTIAGSASPLCPIINVGSDEAVLMGDLAIKISDYFGVKANMPQLTNITVDRYIPSIRAALEIGCKPPLALDVAIDKTIRAIDYYNS